MIHSENILLPVSPVTPNHITQKEFPAAGTLPVLVMPACLEKLGNSSLSQKGKESVALLGQSDPKARLLSLKKGQIPLRSAMPAKHNSSME
jgi:hypothetical protein